MEYYVAFENVLEESFMTRRNINDIYTKKNKVINQNCINTFFYIHVCM